MFRRPIQPPVPKRSEAGGKEVQPESVVPPITSEAVWDGHFPDANGDIQASIEYSNQGLREILVNDTLIVTRQIEMLNIFLGFEQANRYAIMNQEGQHLGFILEQGGNALFRMLTRQFLRTHRPFNALIMDTRGYPLLWVKRPFAFINSKMYAQRRTDETDQGALETFAEAQQRWHPWRRRYDLYMRKEGNVHSISEEAATTSVGPEFVQFARVDAGLWAWNFVLEDSRRQEIASVTRGFRGWGRELFTDTGQYTIRFTPAPTGPEGVAPPVIRHLTPDERALILALSVNIDFDYFSRHSETGVGFSPWLIFGGDE